MMVETSNIRVLGLGNWATFMRETIRKEPNKILISIYMISPHWKNTRRTSINILQELILASDKLSIKRIVVGRPETNAGGRNFNYAAARMLQNKGWDIRIMRERITLHEKVWIIGNDLTIVGSHNISRSSATTNLDTSIAITSKEITEILEAQFYERWKIATPLTNEDNKNANRDKAGNTSRTYRTSRRNNVRNGNPRTFII